MQFDNVYFILGPNSLDSITFSEYIAKQYLTHISESKGTENIDYKIIRRKYNKLSPEEIQLIEYSLELELDEYGFEYDDTNFENPNYILNSGDQEMLENDIQCRSLRTINALNRLNYLNFFIKMDDEERKVLEVFHMMMKKKYDDYIDQDELWDEEGNPIEAHEFLDYKLCYNNYLMLYK